MKRLLYMYYYLTIFCLSYLSRPEIGLHFKAVSLF